MASEDATILVLDAARYGSLCFSAVGDYDRRHKTREDHMRRSMLALAVITMAGTIATAASAQTSTSPTGPAFSTRFFTTALENDPSRDVQLQMQLHLPSRPAMASIRT